MFNFNPFKKKGSGDPSEGALGEELLSRALQPIDEKEESKEAPEPSSSVVPKSVAVRAVSGPNQGKFFFIRGKSVLGRDEGELLIEDPLVSSTHCVFQFSDGIFTILDLKSSNGTYVNGERIPAGKTVVLSENDSVKVGSTELKLLFYYQETTSTTIQAVSAKSRVANRGQAPLQSKEGTITGTSAKEISRSVPLALRLVGVLTELMTSIGLALTLYIFLAQNAFRVHPLLHLNVWDFYTGMLPGFLTSTNLGVFLSLFLLIFVFLRLVPKLFTGKTLGGLLFGYYLCDSIGRKLNPLRSFLFEWVGLAINLPTLGLAFLIPSLFTKNRLGVDNLLLKTRMGQRERITPGRLGFLSARALLIGFTFFLTPFIVQFMDPLLQAKPDEVRLGSPKTIADLPPGFEYFPLYDLMVALPLNAKDWNVFPELKYAKRDSNQFLDKLSFYFARQGQVAMNKITFLGRRKPSYKLYEPYLAARNLSAGDKKEFKMVFTKNPGFFPVDSKGKGGIPPLSEVLGQGLKREILLSSAGAGFSPAGIKWVTNSRAEFLMILYVPERPGSRSPLEERELGIETDPENFGSPWLEVMKIYKNIEGSPPSSREIEVRLLWQEGGKERDVVFLSGLLSSLYVPKDIADGLRFVNSRLAKMPNIEAMDRLNLPLSLLISKLSLSPNDLNAYYHFAGVNFLAFTRIKAENPKHPFLSVARANILSSYRYMQDLASEDERVGRVRALWEQTRQRP